MFVKEIEHSGEHLAVFFFYGVGHNLQGAVYALVTQHTDGIQQGYFAVFLFGAEPVGFNRFLPTF